MAATVAQTMRLRRMVNELGVDTYSDVILADYIERYPLLDSEGNAPTESDWTATYDLHSAAADVWDEKAAVVACDYDVNADGSSMARSQVYQQYMKQARYHRSRRSAQTVEAVSWPKETTALESVWIGNQAEDDDLL